MDFAIGWSGQGVKTTSALARTVVLLWLSSSSYFVS